MTQVSLYRNNHLGLFKVQMWLVLFNILCCFSTGKFSAWQTVSSLLVYQCHDGKDKLSVTLQDKKNDMNSHEINISEMNCTAAGHFIKHGSMLD